MATFELRAFGATFATRGRAAEVRARALELASDGVLRLDFQGVDHVSSSFADELVGVLVSEHSELTIEVVGLRGDVKRIVDCVLDRRRALGACAA